MRAVGLVGFFVRCHDSCGVTNEAEDWCCGA